MKDYPLSRAADHGVSEAIYLKDSGGNGIELYFDKPETLWPFDADGTLQMIPQRLDLLNLLVEAVQ